MALSFKIARKYVKRIVAKRGIIESILEYAEFATSLTPSKKDDAVVAKVRKALENVEDEVKKVVKKAKAIKKAVKS